MSPAEKTYEEGLRDGRLEHLENQVREIRLVGDTRHNETNERLRSIEKIVYGLTGAVALLQLGPVLLKLAEAFAR